MVIACQTFFCARVPEIIVTQINVNLHTDLFHNLVSLGVQVYFHLYFFLLFTSKTLCALLVSLSEKKQIPFSMAVRWSGILKSHVRG